jgi:hypothetical protein
MRRMITGSLALSVGLTSAVLVVPVLTGPLAAAAQPVATHASELRLGDVAAPADGVTQRSGLPAGIALAPDAAAQLNAARSKTTASARTANRLAASAVPATAAPRTVSVRREATGRFSAVGVTWAHDPAVTGVSVAVRARDAAGKWGAWSSSDAEDAGRTGPGVRDGAGMIWTGPARGVEVAVTSVTGAAPRDVRVELIDPGTSATDGAPTAVAPAAVAPGAMAAAVAPHAGITMPKIYSRAAWGADEKQMTWAPSYAPRIKAVTLHHTVNSNTYTREQVPALLRSIYYHHAVSNGWGDVGYNVIVDRFGRLWEGRAGGLTRAVVGAHAGGFNYETAGISMLGTYTTAAVPSVVREAVAQYAAWKLSLYGVSPTGTTSLTGGPSTKYKNVVTVKLDTIFPHRATSLTACPGSGGMSALPWIRKRAAELMGSWATPARPAAELSTFDRFTGKWYFRNGSTTGWGRKGDVAQPGDWTGDSKADLMVYRPSTAQWLLRGGAPFVFGKPGAGDLAVAGYWGRGNALDAAVFRSTTGYWYIRGGNRIKLGSPGDRPVPADYDGDGRTDAATFTPTSAKWTIAGQPAFVFGKAGDLPVPADYNGDGRAEAAVYRPGTGEWILKGGTTTKWSMRDGDVPVPGLYDNDLKADLAVWHPRKATFHIRSNDAAHTVTRVVVGRYTTNRLGQTPLLYR